MTHEETLAMLKPFCSTDELRPTLVEPFVRGGWRYATNGRIVARVPAPNEVDTPNTPNAGLLPWTHAEVKLWATPEPYNGRVTPEHSCSECRGTGIQECPTCHQDTECFDCCGEGKIEEYYTEAVVGKAHVNGQFYTNMLKLPGLVLAKEDLGGGKSLPLRFQFDGGEGLVMTIAD